MQYLQPEIDADIQSNLCKQIAERNCENVTVICFKLGADLCSFVCIVHFVILAAKYSNQLSLQQIADAYVAFSGLIYLSDQSCCTGNLGRVDYITEYEYDLFIRPDTCNPRFRVWFNFTVENVKADQVMYGDEWVHMSSSKMQANGLALICRGN